MDEKFNDIQNIETDLNFSIKNLKNFIDKKIFLTSYNNKFDYYKNLKLLKINYKSINFNILSESDVLIIENIPIHDFQSMLENSFFNISSHSGYFVHTSLALNKNTIDLINENDLPWISSWLYKPKNYKVLLKSTNNGSKNICDIFDELKMKLKVKSGIILPLKENYTVENFGAVSVWVSDYVKYSKHHNLIFCKKSINKTILQKIYFQLIQRKIF